MVDTALWQTVLGEMELSTSKSDFKTWLSNTKLHAIADNVVVISVASIFIRQMVEDRYKDKLLASFQKYHHDIDRIEFLIESVGHQAPVFEAVVEDSLNEPLSTPTPATPPEVIDTPAATLPAASTRTFTTFVEGNANRLAYTVSQAVAKRPGTLYNPLFIYGGVGLGKTHLMHAIANHIVEQDRSKKILYVTSETFTNDFIGAIQSKSTGRFKDKYRSLDLLLVDDIQFIANKEGSQEEFFNTFNTLHQSNRQIVIAADRPPKAIPGLEERLSSRFGWGMVVDIQPPNFETRLAILQSKCAEKGVTFPVDALEYIATQVKSNIRDLEGNLNRVIMFCDMSHIAPSGEAARAALSGLVMPQQTRTYSIDTFLSTCADYFGVSVADLLGHKRTKEIVYPRHVVMYLMRDVVDLTFPDIGRELGGKDHTTIMHAYNKIITEMATDSKLQTDLLRLKERIANLET